MKLELKWNAIYNSRFIGEAFKAMHIMYSLKKNRITYYVLHLSLLVISLFSFSSFDYEHVELAPANVWSSITHQHLSLLVQKQSLLLFSWYSLQEDGYAILKIVILIPQFSIRSYGSVPHQSLENIWRRQGICNIYDRVLKSHELWLIISFRFCLRLNSLSLVVPMTCRALLL